MRKAYEGYQLPTFNALACCSVSLKMGISGAIQHLNKLKTLIDDTGGRHAPAHLL